ncbi:MAG: flagellar hook-associated protein 3 [Spirochaetes bacterium GWD1_61_31]|nr:MAG: flagellar hook-associated protein 3 [Spirochaetes bacterium GWB1_60_80]OHD43996.1 MAG: flagellar hook-associated protein 3 [Spirochaetes bacterium GWD1_61_31]OHD46192.1 MAG: flagellar hook-associated protein 3 [Spirochaetes bacterium GWE1_60_18]OHD60730.1 MAG: flagellar hook-associated protein 3 [Spirochaetes bacterium GWF1_60_12]HAP43879.1 flagellar hook-associated protein 3 [Spirochaetaceae bacterium]
MRRISSDMMNTDTQFWLRRREDAMTSMQNRMNRQTRIENPRDDPMAAAHAVRYDSFASRLMRYEENIQYTMDRSRIAEGYMRQTQDIMQRVRELAVTGANGTFSPEDTAAMAVEVDQLLAELVSLGNARGPDGDFLFAGDKSKTEPFRALDGHVPGAGGSVTATVDYLGGIGTPQAEISEESYLEMNLPGDAVFWAERQRIAGGADATTYRVLEAGSIFINGAEIGLRPGDTVQAIIAKINDSGVAVRASLDPVSSSLVLEGTQAQRLRLEDGQGGSVLADLGILSGSGVPSDYAASTSVSGGSLFDVVMNLRNALYKGDHLEIGGRALAAIDAGMDNMNRRLAEAGAMMNRLETASMRLNKEIPDVVALGAAETSLDMAQAITDFRMLDYARQAALQMAGRVLPKTLLDFLR